jgi:GTP-binding protein
LIILSVEFAGAIARPGGPVPSGDLPQVAFAGRSNVGKSSLINRLLGRTRKTIARVSSTPGKTQEINFFRIGARLDGDRDTEFFLVDLPGYGYAKVPLAVRDSWKPLIESYLSRTSALRGVVQLIDMRHDPTTGDRQMLEYLAELGLPTIVVLTKSDKLGVAARSKRERELLAALELPRDQVIAFSAVTGAGRDELLDSLGELLGDDARQSLDPGINE